MDKNIKEYSTSEVATQLDLPESTVRYYALEFDNHLQIPRNRAGYRIFNQSHLAQLDKIKTMLKDEGLSIKQVHQKLNRHPEVLTSDSFDSSLDSLDHTSKELITALDSQQAQRINEVEQAIMMLVPLLKQICQDQTTNAQKHQKELAIILQEMKQLQKQLTENHSAQKLSQEENIRRTDELITAWREQQKANVDVAVAIEKIQTNQPSKGLLARIFGFK